MDIKIWIILSLFVAVICLDYKHNQLENMKEYFSFSYETTTPPQPLTKNCRLTENKQPYNYPQPSDKFMSLAQECISQQDFENKDYYNPDNMVVNARIAGYPRQPRKFA